jgi:hypothetical protein
MTTYYVANLAKYVLVEADSAAQARELGRVGLERLHAEVGRRLGKDLPVNILVVRPATSPVGST